MRRCVLALALSLAFASPAGAQSVALRPAPAPAASGAEDAQALGLRGAGPARSAPRGAGLAVAAPDLLRPLPAAAPPDGPLSTPDPAARQCRLACAQSYYFCSSNDASDECAPAWAQCRVRCGALRYGAAAGPPSR